MQIIQTTKEMQDICLRHKQKSQSIGLVPTMGYLHAGHLSLVQKAREEHDILVVSVFVNPTQFGVGEDFEVYPRDLSRDAALLEEAKVDYCFAPSPEEMYPTGYATFVETEGEITHKLCGKSRPTHFKGVTTVVAKLFNICQPDEAYFGQKDAQQVSVIEKMTRELNLPVRVRRMPIVRETDGLALSSRNIYLSPEDRAQALVLSRSLQMAQDRVTAGERDARALAKAVEDMIHTSPLAQIDYVEIVNPEDLTQAEVLTGPTLIALAVKFGSTRLLDNIVLEVR